jgi:hypothetical protein
MYFSASLRFVLGSQGVFQYCFALSAWNCWFVASRHNFSTVAEKKKHLALAEITARVAPSVEY